ncbi:MAG TPA: metallophosphoesterase [Pyrinomonadaceae bacterium]|jgi:predicted MPP superfamily phosphohydrolase
MQPAEELRVLTFLAVIGIVYILAIVVAVKMALARFGRLQLSRSRRQVWLRRLILGLAAFGLVCFGYARFVEPYWPEVSHVRIESRKIPPGNRPVRIVHISDLHSDPEVRLEERLPDIVAAERPDLIVFTGDAINSPAGLPVMRRCLTRLASIAPTFVVRGNWDSWYWGNQDLYGGTGAHVLDGAAEQLNIQGTNIWITGLAVGNEARMKETLDVLPPDGFSIFLYHYPDAINEVAERQVDLYCAGHTHGGQVALPWYGALVTLSRFGKKYEAGLYHVGATALYVNRGIGMEGGPAPRVRFCSRPEVTVIELAPASQ